MNVLLQQILNMKMKKIIFLKENLYDCMPDEEEIYNETVAKFVYSVAGISRISQELANKLYFDLFEEYRKYLSLNNCSNKYNNNNFNNNEIIRKNFSIWIKKCLKKRNL